MTTTATVLLQVIRRNGINVPIVAMTANAADRDRDECLAAGMDGFLSKPVLRDRLADAILRALSGRQRYLEADTVALPYSEPGPMQVGQRATSLS